MLSVHKFAIFVLGSLVTVCGCSTGKSFLANHKDATPEMREEERDLKYEVARVHEKQGQLQQANKIYMELLAQNPRDAKVLHRLGIISAKQEDHEQASHFFVKALRVEPDNSEILTDFGYALYLKGDMSAAEFSLKQALSKNSQNERAINNLAMVVGRQGRMEESFALFRRVSGEAEATSNLAYVYAQLGDVEKATEGYSRALTVDADLEKASNALVQIAQSQPDLTKQNMTARHTARSQVPRYRPTSIPAPDTSNTQAITPAQTTPQVSRGYLPEVRTVSRPVTQPIKRIQARSVSQPVVTPASRPQVPVSRNDVSSKPIAVLDGIDFDEEVAEPQASTSGEKWFTKWERRSEQQTPIQTISGEQSEHAPKRVTLIPSEETDPFAHADFKLPVIRASE